MKEKHIAALASLVDELRKAPDEKELEVARLTILGLSGIISFWANRLGHNVETMVMLARTEGKLTDDTMKAFAEVFKPKESPLSQDLEVLPEDDEQLSIEVITPPTDPEDENLLTQLFSEEIANKAVGILVQLDKDAWHDTVLRDQAIQYMMQKVTLTLKDFDFCRLPDKDDTNELVTILWLLRESEWSKTMWHKDNTSIHKNVLKLSANNTFEMGTTGEIGDMLKMLGESNG